MTVAGYGTPAECEQGGVAAVVARKDVESVVAALPTGPAGDIAWEGFLALFGPNFEDEA